MGVRSLCILVCAGSGTRMGSSIGAPSKVLINLKENWTVLHEVLCRLLSAGVSDVVLVCPSELKDIFREVAKSFESINFQIVSGGKSRTESVRNGLSAIPLFAKQLEHEVILVHDGARPFFSAEVLKEAICKASENNQGYVFAVPVINTIKLCSQSGTIEKTLDRNSLWEIQTPQIFPKHVLLKAYRDITPADSTFDDSTLVERLDEKVSVIESDYSNFKITTKTDIERAFLEFKLSSKCL